MPTIFSSLTQRGDIEPGNCATATDGVDEGNALGLGFGEGILFRLLFIMFGAFATTSS